MMKMPNCSQYGDKNTQRPKIIEGALQTKQPANSNEYRCVGFVMSFDLLQQTWITLPCDMKFLASFMCENIPNNTRIDIHKVSAPNKSTSFHFVTKDNHTVLNKPHMHCSYPWRPADQECFTFQPAKRPHQMSPQWLTHSCNLLNATVFTCPKLLLDIGISTQGISPEVDLLIAAEGEMWKRGFKVLVMKGPHDPAECCIYYTDVVNYECIKCTSKDTSGLPELLHVLCISSSPGETLQYNIFSTYACSSTGVIISASFRCDGIMQCAGGDDELNCTSHSLLVSDCSPFSLQMHKSTNCLMCPEFYIACGNGTCIPQDALCNGYSDCADGWDEQICVFTYSQLSFDIKPKPNHLLWQCNDESFYDVNYHCMYEYDGNYDLLHCSDGSHMSLCNTFGCPRAFKCPFSYCIPIRQVCDGRIDCPSGDDEVNCELLQCTGLFQCRQSARCLPPWDICDGIVHCTDFLDDEIYCAPCPHGMHCHGNAAVCTNSTDNDMHINGSQSWVKVVHCHHKAFLQVLSRVEWHTLSYLNIQHSEIAHLDFDLLFSNMRTLSYLNAAFNRVVFISSSSKFAVPLKILDLSHNMIAILSAYGLRQFHDLVMLVLHHNDISIIQRWAFFGFKALASVDITHNPLAIHDVSDLPQQSPLLMHFHSDMLAVCCLLSHVPHCTPQSSLFSSCENLLYLKVHRVLMTGQAVFTLLANCAVIIFSGHLKKKEKFQMIHLTAFNLFMSLYLTMMTAVDIYYRNRFALVAVKWKYLAPCKIAASANMIAAEVSLSLLLSIFIFRAYSLHKLWNTISSTVVEIVCFAIWIVWAIYTSVSVAILSSSGVPLESNICILVYFNDATHSWLTLAHSVVYVAVNLLKVTSLIIAYVFIAYRAVAKKPTLQSVSTNRAKRNRQLFFRLFIMFFFNISCWIPMITNVILSLIGVEMPTDRSVWMAIVVVPINASFCPIMYCLMPMLMGAMKKKKRLLA